MNEVVVMTGFLNAGKSEDVVLATESEKYEIKKALRSVFTDETRKMVSAWYVRTHGQLEVPFETQQEQRIAIAGMVLAALGLEKHSARAKVFTSRSSQNLGSLYLSPSITTTVCIEDCDGSIILTADVDVTSATVFIKHFHLDAYISLRRKSAGVYDQSSLPVIRRYTTFDRAVAWYVFAVTLGSFFITVKKFWL